MNATRSPWLHQFGELPPAHVARVPTAPRRPVERTSADPQGPQLLATLVDHDLDVLVHDLDRLWDEQVDFVSS
jgi:hypothetical protein